MAAKDQYTGDNLINSGRSTDEQTRDINKVHNLFQGAYGDDQGRFSYRDKHPTGFMPDDKAVNIDLLPYYPDRDRPRIDLLPYYPDRDRSRIEPLPNPYFPDHGFIEIPKDPFGKHPNWGDFKQPTDREERSAERKLDKEIDRSMSPEDRQNLKDINHAILTGDDKALAGLLAKYKDDPEKLQAIVDESNRELKSAHAGVALHMSEEGKVYAYRENGNKAVEMDPDTGCVTGVRNIKVDFDGEVHIGRADKHANPDKVMEHIADRAVSQINDPFADFDRGWVEKLKHHRFDPSPYLLMDAANNDKDITSDSKKYLL